VSLAELVEHERRLIAEVTTVRRLIKSLHTDQRVRDAKRAVVDRTLADVVLVTGTSSDRITGKDRRLARHRFAWWWLAHHVGGATTYQIGKTTGRDHTTVLYGIRQAMEHPKSRAIVEAVLTGAAARAAADLGIKGPIEALEKQKEEDQ
jgi:chromosomal replication initiation ATPase DnaA